MVTFSKSDAQSPLSNRLYQREGVGQEQLVGVTSQCDVNVNVFCSHVGEYNDDSLQLGN